MKCDRKCQKTVCGSVYIVISAYPSQYCTVTRMDIVVFSNACFRYPTLYDNRIQIPIKTGALVFMTLPSSLISPSFGFVITLQVFFLIPVWPYNPLWYIYIHVHPTSVVSAHKKPYTDQTLIICRVELFLNIFKCGFLITAQFLSTAIREPHRMQVSFLWCSGSGSWLDDVHWAIFHGWGCFSAFESPSVFFPLLVWWQAGRSKTLKAVE